MIRSDGYPSYMEERSMSNEDKNINFCAVCKNRYPDSKPCRTCITHPSAKYPSKFEPYNPNYVINKVKKEKENMTTKIENKLTKEEFLKNVDVSFNGMTCNIEQANIANHYNKNDEIGFRIIGTIPNKPSLEDMIKKAIKNVNKNFSTRIVSYDIKDVIFNPPATIVFWEDGTKTVVKASNEEFDPEKGLAMAVTKRLFGNKYEYFNQIKKWTNKYYKAHPAGDA